MKINMAIKTLTFFCATTFSHHIHTFFNDNFDDEFLTSMNHLEKQFEESTNNMRLAFKELHNKFFEDFDTRSKDFPLYDQQQNLANNQSSIKHYQQSSSSLSFANYEKAIKIVVQKDSATTNYIITVADKQAENTIPAHNGESNIANELNQLNNYIKKNFTSKPAEKILEECINAIDTTHNDSLVNVQVSTNENQKKYTVEIAHKKETDINQSKQGRKHKKSSKNA